MREMTGFSHILWRQRRLLELLAFKLDTQQALLLTGKVTWLERSTKEVEHVLESLRELELERAVALAELGPLLGLGVEPTLREIEDAAPEPWGAILREHHESLVAATEEIARLKQETSELLARNQQATQELVMVLTGADVVHAGGYSSGGGSTKLQAPARTMDRLA